MNSSTHIAPPSHPRSRGLLLGLILLVLMCGTGIASFWWESGVSGTLGKILGSLDSGSGAIHFRLALTGPDFPAPATPVSDVWTLPIHSPRQHSAQIKIIHSEVPDYWDVWTGWIAWWLIILLYLILWTAAMLIRQRHKRRLLEKRPPSPS